MVDIVQQMINESTNLPSFKSAATAVQSHLRVGRDPDYNHTLVVGLMAKGHALIAEHGLRSQPEQLWQISKAVMDTLATDPRS